MIERSAQAPMIVVLDCHEAKRLQHAVVEFAHRAQDFSHRMHGTSLGLERDFHEVARAQRPIEAQQASSDGDGLEIGFRAAAVFEANRSQDRISKLDSAARREGCGWGK